MNKWEELLRHQGHKIVVAQYENGGEVHNISLECDDCWEVLESYDKEGAICDECGELHDEENEVMTIKKGGK